jgi:hypothetical protein
MNIYGNPKDPACVELGIYARGERLKRFQEIARQFFAGYIGSRSDLATLYHLNLSGDEQRAGKFIYKVQPSSDPHSYGAWWLSIYDPVRLKRDRVSDALYNKMTLPSDKIREKDGKLQRMWEEQYRQLLNYTMTHLLGKSPNFHGFYRDSQNRLQLLKTASDNPSARSVFGFDSTRNNLKYYTMTSTSRAIHINPSYHDSIFQVASQFNALEMVNSTVTPQQGISNYIHDGTQGPECAMMCPFGTLYRNYFCMPNASTNEQPADKSINANPQIGTADGKDPNNQINTLTELMKKTQEFNYEILGYYKNNNNNKKVFFLVD